MLTNFWWFSTYFGFLAFLGFWPKLMGFAILDWGIIKGWEWYRWRPYFQEPILGDFQDIWRSFSLLKWRKMFAFSTLCPIYQQALFFGFLHTGLFLEDFQASDWENSSCYRNYTLRAFKQAIMSLISTSGRLPKVAGKSGDLLLMFFSEYFCKNWTFKNCFFLMCV